MSRLAKKNKVLFVDPPRPLGAQVREFGLPSLAGHTWQPDREDLYVLSPLQLPGKGKFDFVADFADPYYFAWQIKRALGRYDAQALILFLGNPWNTFMLKVFPDAVCTVYHCSDDFPCLFEGPFKQRLAERERQMVRGADLVLAVSKSLAARCRNDNPRTYLFPNAYDEKFGHKAEKADELSGLPRPLVGYVGSIDQRFDFQLIREVVQNLSMYTFVFIGPVAADMKYLWERICTLPNVKYLGPKPWCHLPVFMQAFDCCINPLVRDEFNAARSPLKTYEYLASGRMVVNTMPAEPRLAMAVHTAETAAGFAGNIVSVLNGRFGTVSPADINKLVGHDTWGARVEELSRLVKETTAGG
jgi:hypothetical protein